DADGGEPLDAAGLADHLPTGPQGRVPDFCRVVLDPAWPREMLFQLDLADGAGPQAALRRSLEGDGAGRGRALVDGEDQRLHSGRLERRSADSTDHRGEAASDHMPWGPAGSSPRTPRTTKDTKGSESAA